MLDRQIVVEKSPQTIPASCKSRRILVADDERAFSFSFRKPYPSWGMRLLLPATALKL